MSCIITYKGNKYTQEQFKEYISNNKKEFSHIMTSNKNVIDSFKRKMEGIDFVFSQSPELASIGSKVQYLQYLSTIFKTSKVKDIVYHGSPKTKLERIEGISFWTNEKGNAYAYNIERNSDNSEGFVTSAIVNIKNPYIHQEDVNSRFATTTPKDLIDSAKSKNADGAIWRDVEDIAGRETQTIVFEPEQIHILGSKQDIEGFKSFIKSNTKTVRKGAILPSIKGHAQFSTDNGIGWFRSDDKYPFTGFLEDLIASGTIKKVPCG